MLFQILFALLSVLVLGTVLGRADKLLTFTAALPNGAASTTSTAIDLETVAPANDLLAHVEFEVQAPALTTGQLGDTQTITYIVETSATSDFSSITTLIASLAVQTGAGGAGAVAVTKRFQLPTDCQRFVRIKATKTGASNASTASLTFRLLQLA